MTELVPTSEAARRRGVSRQAAHEWAMKHPEHTVGRNGRLLVDLAVYLAVPSRSRAGRRSHRNPATG